MKKAQATETETDIEYNSIELKNGDVWVYDIESFAQIHDDTGKLPIPMVLCNVREVARTCFGTNLEKQVTKAGNIRNFLNTYVCLEARNEAKRAAKATVDSNKIPTTVS